MYDTVITCPLCREQVDELEFPVREAADRVVLDRGTNASRPRDEADGRRGGELFVEPAVPTPPIGELESCLPRLRNASAT